MVTKMAKTTSGEEKFIWVMVLEGSDQSCLAPCDWAEHQCDGRMWVLVVELWWTANKKSRIGSKQG